MRRFPRTVATLQSELGELSASEMPHAARPKPDEVLGALVLLRLKYPDLFSNGSARPTHRAEALVSLFGDESESDSPSDCDSSSDSRSDSGSCDGSESKSEHISRELSRVDCASDASSVPDIVNVVIDMAGGEHASSTFAQSKPGDLLRSIANIFAEHESAEHDSAAHVAFHGAHSEPAHVSAFEGGADCRSVLSSLTAVEAFAEAPLSWHAERIQ